MALGHVIDLSGGEERELHMRYRLFEAAHKRQPIIERELTRVMPTDDMELVKVSPRLQCLLKDRISGHALNALFFFELIDGEGAERGSLARGFRSTLAGEEGHREEEALPRDDLERQPARVGLGPLRPQGWDRK